MTNDLFIGSICFSLIVISIGFYFLKRVSIKLFQLLSANTLVFFSCFVGLLSMESIFLKLLCLAVPIVVFYFSMNLLNHRFSEMYLKIRSLNRYSDESYVSTDKFKEIEVLLKSYNRVFEHMNTNFSSALTSITNTTQSINVDMGEQNAFLAEQSSSLNQTASTVEQLGITSDQTTEKAMLVVNSAEKSIDISKRGHEAFKRTVSSMSTIRKKVERIALKILDLSAQTQKIGSIINTVNELSEFTNLLALNAAIEASKAGEFGKGFSVVASEIRRLSIQSQNAVAEIADIITEIQNATNSTVMATEEGTKEVDVGVNLITKAGTLMEESLASLDENLNAARQILAANKQQTIGIEQITYAISSLNDAMRQISTGSDISKNVLSALEQVQKDLQEMSV